MTEPLRRTGLLPALAHLPATIPAVMEARASTPDDDFVIGPHFRLTFGEADRRSFDLAARLLASGVGKGTRLALLFANDADWVVTWLAAARIGALTVPLSTFSPGAELARAIRHADVQCLLLAPSFAGVDLTERIEQALPGLDTSGPDIALEGAPFLRWAHVIGGKATWSRDLAEPVADAISHAAEAEVYPADPLAILSTSGATAAPKAVVHTHGSLVRHAAILAERRGLDGHDRIYSPMPFFWVGGITMALLAALTSGAATLCQEKFEPGEALDLMEKERVTQVQCWPNAAKAMADHPSFPERDLSAMRGGALVEALPPDVRPPSPDLSPAPLGMTEAGGPHTGHDDMYRPLPEHLRGTFGRSLPGMEHRVVDPESGTELGPNESGELLLRGAYMMTELYKRERHDTFTPDGWYATGDLGSLDDEGFVRFGGRMTAMIKSGGSNVAPAEVEAVLAEIPGVRFAHVFGVRAGDRGEDVAAVVVHERDATLDVDALAVAARERLSSYKVPRQFRVLAEDELPMLATGKVDMVALRALF